MRCGAIMACAIALCALEDAPPLPAPVSNAWRGRGVVVTVGAGEGEYALAYAREIADNARARGAHVRQRVLDTQRAHTFPPDLEQVLPQWLETIDPAFAASRASE